jgi:hypothetical protein
VKILNKREFFELWEAGCLGNRTRLWRDPEQAVRDAKRLEIPEIGFRQMGRAGGGAWEKVPRSRVIETASRWREAGRSFILDDGAPDEYRTCQGEIARTYRGLEGYIEVGGHLPMRQALAAGLMKSVGPAMVLALLDRFMDPSSRDDLDAIWDLYPDATVEFTCFSRDVGVLPGRNTLFWEVRDY